MLLDASGLFGVPRCGHDRIAASLSYFPRTTVRFHTAMEAWQTVERDLLLIRLVLFIRILLKMPFYWDAILLGCFLRYLFTLRCFSMPSTFDVWLFDAFLFGDFLLNSSLFDVFLFVASLLDAPLYDTSLLVSPYSMPSMFGGFHAWWVSVWNLPCSMPLAYCLLFGSYRATIRAIWCRTLSWLAAFESSSSSISRRSIVQVAIDSIESHSEHWLY